MNLQHIKWVFGVMFCTLCFLGCESKSKRDFKAGCKQGGADSSTCACIYDKMEKYYSPELMANLGNMTLVDAELPADFPERTVQAALECRPKR